MNVFFLTIYRLAGLLLTPFLPLYLKKRAQKGKEDASRLNERFGKSAFHRPDGRLIWLHAASVGELQSLQPVLKQLLAHYKDVHLLVTTGTVTSAALFEKMQLERAAHQFVPLDHYFCVKRFLQNWQPDLALWVESEFWPEMLHQTQKMGIPTALLNARISAKSTRSWQRLRGLIQPILAGFSFIIASTEKDAERLISLGAPEENIYAITNLKYDAANLACDATSLGDLVNEIRGRPVLLAASTHQGEEAILARVVARLRETYPNILLIIAPRHATRGGAIYQELLAEGYNTARRGANSPITPETEIYLADTMGELGMLYRIAPIAFIGGSMVPHGGQNLLEAARLNTAIITGPHLFNFEEISEYLAEQNALLIAQNEEELLQHCLHLFEDDTLHRNMVQNAANAIQNRRGAVAATMQALAPLLQAEPNLHITPSPERKHA